MAAAPKKVQGDLQVKGDILVPNESISRAAEVDASGKLKSSATTSTELGYVSGVTSAIQTQLGTKASNTQVNTAPTGTLFVSKNGLDTNTGAELNPFLTISAAIAAATSGTTIFIMPGIYTENVTLVAGVSLQGQQARTAIISGNMTAAFSGTVFLHSLDLQASSGVVLTQSGSSSTNLQMHDCYLLSISGASHCIDYTNTNSASKLVLEVGTVNVQVSTSAKCFNSSATAAGSIIFYYVSSKLLDNKDNVCLAVAGALSFTYTLDTVYGQITVANTASFTGLNLNCQTTTVAVFTTNSSSTSSMVNTFASTAANPCFAGAGAFAYGLIGFPSTGEGFAPTLNGGAGAAPIPSSSFQFHPEANTTLPFNGQVNYTGTHLYVTIGSTRYQLDQQVTGTNTGDQTALTVPNTPAGNLSAATVQAALNELDTEKVKKSGDTMSGLLDITVAGAVAIEANDIVIGNPWGAGYSVITAKDGSTDEMYIQSADQLNAFAGIASKQTVITSGYTSGAASGAVKIYSGNAAVSGASGLIDICSGTSLSGTGLVRMRSNPAATGGTGSSQINSGSATTSGNSGYAAVFSGGAATGNSGIAQLNSGNVSVQGVSGNIAAFSGAISAGTGASGDAQLNTGNTVGGASGIATLFSGAVTNATATSSSGNIIIRSGDNTGLGLASTLATGAATMRSGAISNASAIGETGVSELYSGNNAGSGKTGNVSVFTGNNTGTGPSGDVVLSTGTTASGTRGAVTITSRIVEINSQLDMQSNKIVDMANGVDPTDAVTMSQLDARILTSAKGAANGVATLDANSLIPIAQIPPAALERLVIVADETARFALTTATVQNGDTVSQTDTGLLYFVKDDTNLSNASGYAAYTAGTASSVAWSGITGIPAPVTALSGTNTGDQTITLTGDVTGSGTGSFAATLANTAVSASSYGSATQVGTFTVDSKGRLTAAASTSIAIPASQVTDFNEAAQDAVGGALTDSTTIDFTYNDGAGTITAAAITQLSITSDGSGIKLSGDAATPGNTKYYGTDGSGTKGFFSIPSSGSSTGDIFETSFAAANNQAAAADVTGFAFANGVVRSFKALVSITIDATADKFEAYELKAVQKGADWSLEQESVGDDSGVVFTITTAGQVQYTSTNNAGFSSATIKFRAYTLGV